MGILDERHSWRRASLQAEEKEAAAGANVYVRASLVAAMVAAPARMDVAVNPD